MKRAGRAIFVMEYLKDRGNWRLRRKNGEAQPVEGADRDAVLEQARSFVGSRPPSLLEIQDENGLTENTMTFD